MALPRDDSVFSGRVFDSVDAPGPICELCRCERRVCGGGAGSTLGTLGALGILGTLEVVIRRQ